MYRQFMPTVPDFNQWCGELWSYLTLLNINAWSNTMFLNLTCHIKHDATVSAAGRSHEEAQSVRQGRNTPGKQCMCLLEVLAQLQSDAQDLHRCRHERMMHPYTSKRWVQPGKNKNSQMWVFMLVTFLRHTAWYYYPRILVFNFQDENQCWS